jgi:hypothetical protein
VTGFLKNLLDPKAIERAVEMAYEIAKGSGSGPLALTGGVAMQVYGSDRFTKDVDFLAKSVPIEGFVPERVLSFGGASGKLDGTSVCFIVRDDEWKKLYEVARTLAVSLAGTKIKIVKPEFLAVMKLVAERSKDEEDLKKLIRLEAIDIPVTRSVIRKYLGAYALMDFSSYVDEIGWRKSTGRE